MYGLIPLGIVIVIMGLSVAIAVMRGFSKALIRFITVLASAIAAVAVCIAAKAILPDGEGFLSLVRENMGIIRSSFGEQAAATVTELMGYAGISPTLVETIVQLAGALAAPILCVALFILFALISFLIYLLVLLIRRMIMIIRHKEKKKRSRMAAVWVGILQGAVMIAILFIPISGYLSIATPAVDVLVEQDILDGDDPMIQTVQVSVKEVEQSFVIQGYRLLGGNALTNAMTSMRVGEVKTNALQELVPLMTIADGALSLSDTNMSNYGEKEAEAVRLMGEAFANSRLLTPIAGDVLYAATTAWMNGEFFCGMSKPSAGELGSVVDPMTDAIMEILRADAPKTESLRNDVLTFTEMGAIVVENGVLSQMGNTAAILSALDNEGMVNELVAALGQNDSLKCLIPEVTNLGIRALGHFLHIPQNTQQVYDTFLNDVSGTLNSMGDDPDSAEIKELSKQIGTAFDEAGVFIDDEILDLYVTSMVHDLVDNNAGEVTPRDVQAFFMIYAQNMQTVSDGKTEEVSSGRPSFVLLTHTVETDPFEGTVYERMTPEQQKQTAAAVLAGICVKLTTMDAAAEDYTEQVAVLVIETYTELLGEDHVALETLQEIKVTLPVTEDALKKAASMESLAEMEKTSTVVTMDMLLIDAKAAAESINSESIASEANVIVAIFGTAGELAGLIDGSSDQLNFQALAGSVGNILDSLNSTGTFGEDKTASLFTAVLQSKMVRETAGMDMKTATQMAQEATQNGGNYGQTMGAVAGSLGILEKIKNNESVTTEEVMEFMKNLNPQSAGMIKVYVTPARLVNYGVPEKKSGVSAELLVSLCNYMSRDDIEDYETEAETLTKLIQMSIDASNSKNEKLFSSEDGAVVGKLPTAKETVTTALDSKAVRYAVLDVMTDGSQVTRFDPMENSKDIKTNTVEYKDCVNAMREYREEHNDQDDLFYEAVMALAGVEETLN